MNQKIKKEWVTRLRSGAYIQGYGQLKSEVNDQAYHCCLGVLCEIFSEETGIEWNGFTGRTKTNYFLENQEMVLPDSVIKWAELEEHNPVVKIENDTYPLSDLNDGDQFTFEELANLIENQL